MNQSSLFSTPQEKGAGEWSTFQSVHHDKPQPGMFRVAEPEKQKPRYGTAVALPRYKKPHELFPKPAH